MKAKRLLSTLLVCVMLFSFMSVTAFAETAEETPAVTSVIYGADGKALFEATGSGIYDVLDTINMFAGIGGKSATITLNADVVESQTTKIPDGLDVTIDLNGKEISAASDFAPLSSGIIAVERGGALTINDSVGTGKLTSGAVYSAITMTTSSDTNTSGTAKLTVNGGTLTGLWYTIVGNGSRHNTEITINGGTITATGSKPSGFGTDVPAGYGIFHPQNGLLTVNGGTITALTGIEMRAGKLVVNGGTITSTGDFYEINSLSGSTVSGAAVAVSQHGTNLDLDVEISGGTLSGTYALYENDLQDENAEAVNISVTNGTLEGAVKSENITGFISGGSFDTDVSAYVAEGCEMNSSDGTYGVTVAYEAKIGDTCYATIEAAIDEAVTGDTVVLLNNAYTGNNAKDCIIITGKNITLDLNGRTLAQTITDSGASVAAIAIRTDAVLTVKDSVGGGKISATTTPIQLSGTLNLESGTLACDVEPTAKDIENSFLNIVWIYTADASSAPTFNMTGGSLSLGEKQKTFTYTDAIYFATDITAASNYANASVTISGGSVEGTITAEELEDKVEITGGSFTADISSYIPEGSSVTENADGTYSVASAASWTTDTDAGAYNGGALGMMRYLFALDVEGEVTASGIKYIAGNDITSDIKGTATGTASKAFYGDITGISSGTTGTYYAVAYVTIGGKTYWSKPLGNTPDFSKVFTDYTPGGANND